MPISAPQRPSTPGGRAPGGGPRRPSGAGGGVPGGLGGQFSARRRGACRASRGQVTQHRYSTQLPFHPLLTGISARPPGWQASLSRRQAHPASHLTSSLWLPSWASGRWRTACHSVASTSSSASRPPSSSALWPTAARQTPPCRTCPCSSRSLAWTCSWPALFFCLQARPIPACQHLSPPWSSAPPTQLSTADSATALLRDRVGHMTAQAGYSLTLDLFASSSNTQYSAFPEPGASGVDALRQPSWAASPCPWCMANRPDFVLLFPPAPLVRAAVNKARQDQAHGIAILQCHH